MTRSPSSGPTRSDRHRSDGPKPQPDCIPSVRHSKGTIPISVTTTVKNEEQAIGPLLAALSRQSAPPAEVIVVDDRSTDRTGEIVNSFCGHPMQVHFVSTSCNRAQGRNLGGRLARHNLIVCIDAGCIPDEGCLQAISDHFSRSPGTCVAAGAVQSAPESLFEELTGLLLPKNPSLAEIDSGTWLPTSRLIAYRRDAFLKLGGYPERASYCGEDLRFARRLKKAGIRIDFIPEAVARWRPRPTWAGFFVQYYNYAYGDGADMLLSWKYPAKIAICLAGMSLLLGGVYVGYLWHAFAALAGVYAALAACRFWPRRPRATTALLIPIIEIYNDLADVTGYSVGLAVRLLQDARAALQGRQGETPKKRTN